MSMEAPYTTVLMLSANPKGTAPLRLDEERREIEAGLIERSRLRDNFRLITKQAVRPRDFQRAMLDHSPQVVHFSGYGSAEQGLALEDETSQVQRVNAEALASLFELFADSLQCVLLNACYSAVQAEAISQYIPYVIGMSDALENKAAIEFAVAFYDALGAGRDVAFAYRNACVAIKMAGIAEAHIPVLHRKAELSASQDGRGERPFAPTGSIATESIFNSNQNQQNYPQNDKSNLDENDNIPSLGNGLSNQRLEQQRQDLQAEWNLRSEKVQALRRAYVIESGASAKFQLQKQIEAESAELEKLTASLEQVEQALGGQTSKK